MTWLVSAFEPFNGSSSNSSEIVLKALETRNWNGSVRFTRSLPVTFAGAWPALQQYLDGIDGILCLGQAETRERISLERVALNWVDTTIADNAGVLRQQGPLSRESEELRWSNIPWEKLQASKSWQRSYSAGTYVCNALMYELMGWARTQRKMAGFAHIPLLQSQSAAAPMRDQEAIEALDQILTFLVGL